MSYKINTESKTIVIYSATVPEILDLLKGAEYLDYKIVSKTELYISPDRNDKQYSPPYNPNGPIC